jgi:hypothetical protein
MATCGPAIFIGIERIGRLPDKPFDGLTEE